MEDPPAGCAIVLSPPPSWLPDRSIIYMIQLIKASPFLPAEPRMRSAFLTGFWTATSEHKGVVYTMLDTGSLDIIGELRTPFHWATLLPPSGDSLTNLVPVVVSSMFLEAAFVPSEGLLASGTGFEFLSHCAGMPVSNDFRAPGLAKKIRSRGSSTLCTGPRPFFKPWIM